MRIEEKAEDFVPTPSAPTELCGYSINETLSAGQSYLAIGPGGRGIVLKKMDEDCLLRGTLHPSIRERLCRVRELAHGGVANLHGVGREGTGAYMIWEYVPGHTFDEYVAQPSRTPRDLLLLAREIILSVDLLHMQGIVHGALIGGNVIISPDGAVRLTHISPLLYTDADVDVECVRGLLEDAVAARAEQDLPLGQLLAEAGREKMGLRALGARVAALLESPAETTEPQIIAEERNIRRRTLIWAAIVVILGIIVAYGAWRMMDGSLDVRSAFHWNSSARANP